MASISIERAVDGFLLAIRAERDLSPNTVAAYASDLAQFARWAERGEVTRLEGIDRRLLRRYVASLTQRGLARRSIARKTSTLRSLLGWAQSHGHLESNPAADLPAMKLDQPLPRVLKAAEAAALCELPPDDDPVGLRDRAVLEVLYGSGLRVSELCGLDLEDLDLTGNQITVLGKGRKERLVPLSDPAGRALLDYLVARAELLERNPHGTDRHAVFLNTRGSGWGRGAFAVSSTAMWMPREQPTSIPTPCVTPSRLICSTMERTFVLFRSYLGMRVCPLRRSTHMYQLSV